MLNAIRETTMPKAVSPVRLQKDLMQAATLTGARYHRSAAEQVEYWAHLGRQVSAVLDPDVLISISTGLARVKVEPVFGEPVNPDVVFHSLEAERRRGTLAQTVTDSAIKYQASLTHPGYLERIGQDGNITVGQFKNGEFISVTETGR
jgi:hypothetical protein